MESKTNPSKQKKNILFVTTVVLIFRMNGIGRTARYLTTNTRKRNISIFIGWLGINQGNILGKKDSCLKRTCRKLRHLLFGFKMHLRWQEGAHGFLINKYSFFKLREIGGKLTVPYYKPCPKRSDDIQSEWGGAFSGIHNKMA